jgi:hypothetical protein
MTCNENNIKCKLIVTFFSAKTFHAIIVHHVVYYANGCLTESYGAQWCRGMFCALELEGCEFESTSSRHPEQVLHLQLRMRFSVKLRFPFSVRAVTGSASEWKS